MRILVTGGAGFIGSHVVTALSRKGHEVTVYDDFLADIHHDGIQPAFPEGVRLLRANLREEETLLDALRGTDLVCHQAAMVGRGQGSADAVRYVANTDLSTATLLTAMVRLGVRRIILAGSVVIYGSSRYRCYRHGSVRPPERNRSDLDAGRFAPRCPHCDLPVTSTPAREGDYLDPPKNVYAITKLAQENLVATWAQDTGSQAISLRYHNVYGPGMPYKSPYSGVASVFRTAVKLHTPPRVFEDGLCYRDFVHVEDVARANVAALDWKGSGFRAFNIASGRPHTTGEVASSLAWYGSGPAPIITGEYRVDDVRDIVASPARSTSELDWSPHISFESGMREFATASMRGVSGR